MTNGGTKNTNAAGVYTYSGGTATSTLDGQFFRMSDNCGAISLSNSTDRQPELRDQRRHRLHDAGRRRGGQHARVAHRLLPPDEHQPEGDHASCQGNSWLNGKVTANMNINQTCNAFWNGSTVNFYRSGGGCSNTGEIAAVFLHEWGHGMDTNSGGAASENGTGEAVGDTFAFLETRDGCIGQNFLPGHELRELHGLHGRARRVRLRRSADRP